jgi:hypothetical protein
MNVEHLAQVQCEEVSYEYEPTAQDLADAMDGDRDQLIDQYLINYARVYGVDADLDDTLSMSNEELENTIYIDFLTGLLSGNPVPLFPKIS